MNAPETNQEKKSGNTQFQELDLALGFVAKHNWKLFQTASLAFGFLIFLVYFCQHNFYPDFDLFSFLSLLAAAAVLGGSVLVVVGLGFAAPAWIWSEMFFSEKQVRDELEYRINNLNPKEKLDHRLINIYFVLPALICNLSLISSIYFFDDDIAHTISLILAPIVVGLIFGGLLQKNYELPSWSWLRFTFTAFLAFSVCNIVALLSTLTVDHAFPEITAMLGQYPFMILSFVVTLLLLTLLTALGRRDQRFLLLMTPPLAFFLLLVTNTMNVLPCNVVKQLGIGNYKAEQVLFNDATCARYKEIPSYGVKTDCALDNAHITWSMGGIYFIEWTSADKKIKVKVPKDGIISIKLTEPDNSKKTS